MTQQSALPKGKTKEIQGEVEGRIVDFGLNNNL